MASLPALFPLLNYILNYTHAHEFPPLSNTLCSLRCRLSCSGVWEALKRVNFLFLLPVRYHLWRFDGEVVLSLEQGSIAFSLDYWWFSGELRHKHNIEDELLLLSQNLPWSKIIYSPAGFQLHLLIIFHLLLKLWDIFLFHSIIFFFPVVACVLAFLMRELQQKQ